MSVNDILLVVTGGGIGIITALVIDEVRARREKRIRKEEREIEKEKSTIQYFRGLYNTLAPFLSISSQFDHILGGAVTLAIEPPKEPQANQIRALLPEFLKYYDSFLVKGYAGLFPDDLRRNFLNYGEKLAQLNADLKKATFPWNNEILGLVGHISVIGKHLRYRIRELLGVVALDLAYDKKWREETTWKPVRNSS